MADPGISLPPIEVAAAYAELAQEYYDASHQTSRNFDVATAVALRAIASNLELGLAVELGAGRGRIREYLGVPKHLVVQTDVSEAMLSVEPREDCLLRVRCDARSTPFYAQSFRIVAAFLFDPFNTPDFYKEVHRLLVPGGVFVGSLPAFSWGQPLRRELGLPQDLTRFMLRDGRQIVTYSMLSPDEEILCRAEVAGLEASVTGVRLPHGTLPISPDIQRPANVLGVSPYDLPVVQIVLARKKP